VTTLTDIELRPATPADRDFLRDVYASTRAGELALLPWHETAKRAFVEHQFSAQDFHYRRHYEGASFDVIEVAGEAAGRLYVLRGETDIRVMDIALLPAFRGRGIGSSLLRALLDEACGRTVSIHVEVTNPALALYVRLGFLPVEEHGAHLLMAWHDTARSALMEV
jgi:ribosomal protein S18 acetylase RimI-like enzyme